MNKKVKNLASRNLTIVLYMKKISIYLLSIFYGFCAYSQDFKISAKVDERVELMSIVFRLAEAKEYSENYFPNYIAKVNEYFAVHKDHKIIDFSQKMRENYGIGYDAIMSMAVHLKIENGNIDLLENIDLKAIDNRWEKDSIPKFVALLDNFYKESKFHVFFEQQKGIREIAEQNFEHLIDKIDIEWFEKFFGEPPSETYNIIISLPNGRNNYGPQVEFLDGKKDIFSIIGTCQIDSLGMPVYNNSVLEIIIHEFCHSFCNKLIDKNYEKMRYNAEKFFKLQEKNLAKRAYGLPITMLYETLVRVCVIKYGTNHAKTEKETKQQICWERNSGFMWIENLFLELKIYDNNRDKYPTLDSFMQEIVKLQNSLSPEKMFKEQEKQKPNIKVIGIKNNQKNVDTRINKIIVKFDKPMAIGNNGISTGLKDDWEKYGIETTKTYWNKETKKEWIIEIKLEAGKEYSISFPAQFFRTEDYYCPKETFYLDFKTKK
jgi:hypothetical protein